jgi:hypothetical protein
VFERLLNGRLSMSKIMETGYFVVRKQIFGGKRHVLYSGRSYIFHMFGFESTFNEFFCFRTTID